MTEIEQVIAVSSDHLLALPNVIGVGAGEKNGRVAVVVFVTHKVPPERLRPEELVPRELHGIPTDVVEIGVPQAQEQSHGHSTHTQPRQRSRRSGA